MREITTQEPTTCSIKINHKTGIPELKLKLRNALNLPVINTIEIDIEELSWKVLKTLDFLGAVLPIFVKTLNTKQNCRIETFKLHALYSEDIKGYFNSDSTDTFFEEIISVTARLLSPQLAAELKELKVLDMSYFLFSEFAEYMNHVVEEDAEQEPTLECSLVDFFATLPNKDRLLVLNLGLDGIFLGQKKTVPFINALNECTALETLKIENANWTTRNVLEAIGLFVGNHKNITTIDFSPGYSNFVFLISALSNLKLSDISFTNTCIYQKELTVNEQNQILTVNEQIEILGELLENHPNVRKLNLSYIQFADYQPFGLGNTNNSALSELEKQKNKLYFFNKLMKRILKNPNIQELECKNIEHGLNVYERLQDLLVAIRTYPYLMTIVQGLNPGENFSAYFQRLKETEPTFYCRLILSEELIYLQNLMHFFLFELDPIMEMNFTSMFIDNFINLIGSQKENTESKKRKQEDMNSQRGSLPPLHNELASYLDREDKQNLYHLTGGLFLGKYKKNKQESAEPSADDVERKRLKSG